MIISQSPFRISLFGGSTDYKSFYEKYGSLLIGFALNKYCYINIRKTPRIFSHKSSINYSRTEIVKNNADIEHNGVRGVLQNYKIKYGVDLTCLTDLPAQTGIGSSSAFVVGMIKALKRLENKDISKKELAEIAIYIERELLQEPGGIQDSIWSAYGGLNSIEIEKEGDFHVRPLPVSQDFREEFIRRSILVYTGKTRQSFKIAQSHDTIDAQKHKMEILDIAKDAYSLFRNEDLDKIGQLLQKSWIAKKKTSNLISSPNIEKIYKYLKTNGVIGAKLCGAGKNGFLYGILKDNVDKKHLPVKIKKNMIDFNIDYEGSKIIHE